MFEKLTGLFTKGSKELQTKRRIAEVVHNLGGRRMSMTSYVENILRRHLALHRDEINRLHRKRRTRNIL